jgi:hypothetical protein
MFGRKGMLSGEQMAEIVAAKQVICEGFQAAITGGIPK